MYKITVLVLVKIYGEIINITCDWLYLCVKSANGRLRNETEQILNFFLYTTSNAYLYMDGGCLIGCALFAININQVPDLEMQSAEKITDHWIKNRCMFSVNGIP